MTVTKERFLVVRCTSLGEQKLPGAGQIVQASIRDSMQENFGDFGVGCILTQLQVRHYNSDTGLLLVRVAREHAAMLRAALTLVCFIGRDAVRLSVVQIAGSARCGRRALVQLLQDDERASDASTHQGAALRTAVQRHLKALTQSKTADTYHSST